MTSVRLKLNKTLSEPELVELVSLYMKASSIRSKHVAPELPVGEFAFADFINFCILPYSLIITFYIPLLQ